MGISNSKAETCEALRLCKERKKFIKQAIDSRYNLAAAHVVYVESLQNIGIALRKFAEREVILDSSSITYAEKPPPPPPSPPQIDHNGATGGGGDQSDSPSPSPLPDVSLNYMKSSGAGVVTVNVNPSKSSNCNKIYVDDVENPSFTMSPPQPPPPPPRFSWDYFDPTEGSFRFMSQERFQVNSVDTNVHDQFPDQDADLGEFNTPPESVKKDQNPHFDDNNLVANEANGVAENECDLNDGCLSEEETEDTSELVVHGSKDFVLGIKEIENHFIRASKAGNEVSRMLEANKIQFSYSDAKGNSTSTGSSLALLTCFRGETSLVLHEPQQTAKVITWKRSMSSRSSSSLHPPSTPTKNDNENNFMEEFCMIAGSHSSTLERLYAWERKLYDEVKASESIRKEYDRKCDQLRHQFAKDLKPHVIDKTRAMTKDLHSRIWVALHTVDSISKRIEKIRDEELQPQLVELIQGLIKMWKSMLECHHAQHKTISSSHHFTISRTQIHQNESKNQILIELQHEIECFALSFTDLIKCYTSYINSINNWLQNCITQPKERAKSRRVFSPRRAVAPPIFVICRDWLAGVRALPAQKLSDAIKDLVSHVHRVSMEEFEKKEMDVENGEVMGLDLSKIHVGLTKVLDRLTKFSEESLKMYEEIKENSETAGSVYLNYRPPMRAFSV
ncbi:unnamed protein product [Lactuca virosa]|uniref:DUF632 domain-containing protein n=1 Tax=Lactuca virosa TaxID=75947 RepID=A0AAU9M853_9ASTR|nr:unnamed protein product [Lactuca virosa]